jgi:hypothetical protein
VLLHSKWRPVDDAILTPLLRRCSIITLKRSPPTSRASIDAASSSESSVISMSILQAESLKEAMALLRHNRHVQRAGVEGRRSRRKFGLGHGRAPQCRHRPLQQ